MSGPKLLSRQDCEALARRVLGFAAADETQIEITSGATAYTRFARNRISTGGETHDTAVSVTSAFGKRTATVSTNELGDAALSALVKEVEALARISPENPEAMPVLGAQRYPASREPKLQLPSAADRAGAVKQVTGRAAKAGFMAAGYMQVSATATARATSRGLFAYTRTSSAGMTTTVRTPDGTGSGWAGASGDGWGDLDAAALGARAIQKAGASRNPVAIEPGRYTVILEPDAAVEFAQLLRYSLSARSADEGRSFFSQPGGGTKLGTKVVDERITLLSDLRDAQGAVAEDGLPARSVTWVEKGVVKNLSYDRFWAQKQGKEPTAAAPALRMLGGTTSIDQMVAGTERGVLVTRCWYIRGVDPRTLLFTGLTRDGTFLIENGKVARSIKNMRWNESPVFMFNNLDALGPTARVNSEDSDAVYVPAVKCRDFTFSSLSDAV